MKLLLVIACLAFSPEASRFRRPVETSSAVESAGVLSTALEKTKEEISNSSATPVANASQKSDGKVGKETNKTAEEESTTSEEPTLSPPKPLPFDSYEEFLPECRKHLEAVCKSAQETYGPAQLDVAMTQHCDWEEEFDAVKDPYFVHRKDCRKFAKKVAKARMDQIDGKTNTYDSCCEDVWEERGGRSKGSASSLSSFVLVMSTVLSLYWPRAQ
eukprot:TRINITY_DN110747_c0_g1_i1.p1 TRINITY_DN110747_c0_g1~~TRINITY_DN110747_c0_g1_i1.p1  ORF type:complete len:215 (+),score=63.56 TRINITY_DN110747_c0_g1_i1:34-678(+)